MNVIKFSHNYPKLWNQIEAHLIMVRQIDKGCVNEALKEYDTKYHFNERKDHHGAIQDYEEGYYPLPNTDLIQLVFIGNFDIPFCTLRRFTPRKLDYYNNLIGKEFKIELHKS